MLGLGPLGDNYQLSPNSLQEEALSCGLNYCVPPKKTNRVDSQAKFEAFFEQLSHSQPTSTDALGWFKSKLVDLGHQYRTSTTRQTRLITKSHQDALT